MKYFYKIKYKILKLIQIYIYFLNISGVYLTEYGLEHCKKGNGECSLYDLHPSV